MAHDIYGRDETAKCATEANSGAQSRGGAYAGQAVSYGVTGQTLHRRRQELRERIDRDQRRLGAINELINILEG